MTNTTEAATKVLALVASQCPAGTPKNKIISLAVLSLVNEGVDILKATDFILGAGTVANLKGEVHEILSAA
jgi:hypothetical protein